MAKGKLGWLEYKATIYFAKLKRLITGMHPNTNILHPQWIMDRQLLELARDFLENLPVGSKILDVGCGEGPYWNLNPKLDWTGLDVIPTSKTDHVVDFSQNYPFPDESFDFVICTQVLEHSQNAEFVVSEIYRVLKNGGLLFVNIPFFYPLHGVPFDFRRYTPEGLANLVSTLKIVKVSSLGGIGSSLCNTWNNFIQDWGATSIYHRLMYFLIWPLTLLSNLTCNILSLVLDKIDSTMRYPLIVFAICEKSEQNTKIEL